MTKITTIRLIKYVFSNFYGLSTLVSYVTICAKINKCMDIKIAKVSTWYIHSLEQWVSIVHIHSILIFIANKTFLVAYTRYKLVQTSALKMSLS